MVYREQAPGAESWENLWVNRWEGWTTCSEGKAQPKGLKAIAEG
jgi:hypothetical protein